MTVPHTIQLLFEAKNMTVQVELINNSSYKGVLKTIDYNMNIELNDVTDL